MYHFKNLHLYYTMNSGMYVYSGKTGILIDGIHAGGQHGMANMPAQLVSSMMAGAGVFGHLDAVLYTHSHPDHYDRKLLGDYLSSPAGRHAKLYCPRPKPSRDPRVRNTLTPTLIEPSLYYSQIGDFRVLFLDTLHQGKQYRHVYHQSILVESGGETALFLGDGVLTKPAAEALHTYVPAVDLVFINALGLNDPGFGEFFRILPAKKFQAYHIAPEENDIYNYYAVAKSGARRIEDQDIGIDRLEPMTWLTQPAPWVK